MNRIVVGVNSSSSARAALCWAYGAAVREDASLQIITAYQPVTLVHPFEGIVALDITDAREAASTIQHDVLRAELGDDAFDPRIDRLVAQGDAVAVLLEHARHASLLVVGRAAHHWRRLLRRAKSSRCASRASCPLVVVRDPQPWTSRRHRASLRQLEREINRYRLRTGLGTTSDAADSA